MTAMNAQERGSNVKFASNVKRVTVKRSGAIGSVLEHRAGYLLYFSFRARIYT